MAEQVILMRYTSEELEQGMTDREMYQNIKSQMKDGVFLLPAPGRGAGNCRLGESCEQFA